MDFVSVKQSDACNNEKEKWNLSSFIIAMYIVHICVDDECDIFRLVIKISLQVHKRCQRVFVLFHL